ncbi:MAG: hypothetical protein NDI94_05590 [Candidatus Woesearchaeota archaeon]|nr:hypothetical protein [Candidatus Woesearchaeota archaeon]
MKKKPSKLKNAKPEEYFVLVTGVPLKNIKELANSLSTMNEWVFKHHVNDSRNDFSSWVENSLRNSKLAREIKDAKNIKEMELVLFRHLVNNSTQ